MRIASEQQNIMYIIHTFIYNDPVRMCPSLQESRPGRQDGEGRGRVTCGFMLPLFSSSEIFLKFL